MIDKAQLREEEKKKFLKELSSKETALQEAQSEIIFLRGKLRREEHFPLESTRSDGMKSEMMEFIGGHVIKEMGIDNLIEGTGGLIRRRFRRMIDQLPKEFIIDLTKHGLLTENGDLTPKGVEIFREQAKKHNGNLKD